MLGFIVIVIKVLSVFVFSLWNRILLGFIFRMIVMLDFIVVFIFFFSSRRRHTRCGRDWSSDVCSSDLAVQHPQIVYDYVESSKRPWSPQPGQCINYVSCHDNYTLWDKLKSSCPKATPLELKKMVKLAGAVILTSQGVPFLHAGSEFCRTKGGNGNSYKSPDSVNQIDWNLKKENIDVFTYYKNLIALRKNHPAFRMTDTYQIQHHILFCGEYQMGVVSYCIDGKAVGDNWANIVLILNGNKKKINHQLPEGTYDILVQGDTFSDQSLAEVTGTVEVEEISMMLLVKKG